MGTYDQEKQTVLDSTRWLSEHGYLGQRSSGGNISVKVQKQNVVAVTPSGKPYPQLTVDDICVIDFDCKPLESRWLPSIEAAMHIGVYQHRPNLNAVIHTHQTYASLLSVVNQPIPALFDEIVFEIGPVVDIIPYAPSGSPELVQNVAKILDNHCFCYIIQNHGSLCLGTSMTQAMKNVELLENVAQVYFYALITGRKVTTLPQSSIDHFLALRKSRS